MWTVIEEPGRGTSCKNSEILWLEPITTYYNLFLVLLSISVLLPLQGLSHLWLHLLSVWPRLPSSASIWHILFLAGHLNWQLPLRRPHVHICIGTAVICISNITLHLYAYRICEILSGNVISVSLSVWIISESLFGIHCSQVRQYYLTLPIEVQCSISVKAGKQQNASR